MSSIKSAIAGKTVILLLVITNSLYALMLLWSIPAVQDFSNGLALLDMMPTGYSEEYIARLFAALGPYGRKAYLYWQLPIDMVYPFLFGVTYYMLLIWVLTKLRLLHTFWTNFVYLPLIAGFFDYSENIGIILLLNSYPEMPPFLGIITNVFTIAKSVTTSLYFSALLIFILILLFKKAFK